MPFIGNQPALSYTSFAKQDFTTSATTSYTLDNPVANANELALFINFVRQEPTTAYSASGTSLTLTSATSATDDMYCVFLGKAVQTVNPPSGSVGISQLSATGTKDATTFLRGDNTFAGAGITNAQQWRLTTDFTNDANPIASNLEQVDHDGAGKIGSDMTQSSGTFTFPDTGIWYIAFKAAFLSGSGDGANFNFTEILTTINNSSYSTRNNTANASNGGDQYMSAFSTTIFDVTDTSTHKVRFKVNVADSGITTLGDSDITLTGMDFIRLGDT
jgi:hypothetical protein